MASTTLIYASVAAVILLNVLVFILAIVAAIYLHKSILASDASIVTAHSWLTAAAIVAAIFTLLYVVALLYLVFAHGLTGNDIAKMLNLSGSDKSKLDSAQYELLEEAEEKTVHAKTAVMAFLLSSVVMLVVTALEGIMAGVAAVQIGKVGSLDGPARTAYICSILASILGFILLLVCAVIVVLLFGFRAFQKKMIEKAKINLAANPDKTTKVNVPT